MIRLLEKFGGEGLTASHYSRVIRAHLAAYGTGYPFCCFYEIFYKKRCGIICAFNGSVTVDLTLESKPSGLLRREIAEFIDFRRPESVELPAELVPKSGFSGYIPIDRRFYEVPPGGESSGLIRPQTDDAFKALGLPQDSYPLWLTDTVRRMNMGLSDLIGYESAVLNLRFRESGLAFITDLATPPSDRGKGYASELLKRVSAALSGEGFITYLAARPELWKFYEKCGCKTVGSDVIYILNEK